MLVGSCSVELSDEKLQGQTKKNIGSQDDGSRRIENICLGVQKWNKIVKSQPLTSGRVQTLPVLRAPCEG